MEEHGRDAVGSLREFHRMHHPGGFGPGFGGPSMGARARRGDVQTAILALLTEKPMHGYQILQEMTDRSGGVWSPSAGSIYPTLQLLEDQGMLTSEQMDGKRVYALTEAGRAKAETAPEGAPWDKVAGAHGHNARAMRGGIMAVGQASVQVARTGTPEQIEAAQEVLADARRRLYKILAGE